MILFHLHVTGYDVVCEILALHSPAVTLRSEIMLIFVVGYENAKIYKCDKCHTEPDIYISFGSSMDDSFPCFHFKSSHHFQLVRHVSLIDCPGYEGLVSTMLEGLAVADATLLVIGKFILSDSGAL
jgi:translation initiation factor 2 gamma subunit (eIF-2gamma)